LGHDDPATVDDKSRSGRFDSRMRVAHALASLASTLKG
jgi:hypothetical protein